MSYRKYIIGCVILMLLPFITTTFGNIHLSVCLFHNLQQLLIN